MSQLLSVLLATFTVGHLGGNFWLVELFDKIKIGEPTNAVVLIQDPEDVPLLWKDFEIVHEKKVHVVLAKSDASYIQHIHPQASTNTSARLTMSMTFPSPGWYYISYDFSPIKQFGLLAALMVYKFDVDPVSGTLNANESTQLCSSLGVCASPASPGMEVTSAEVSAFLQENPVLEESLWDEFQLEILHGGFSTRLFVPGDDETTFDLDDAKPDLAVSKAVRQCSGSNFTGKTCEYMWFSQETEDNPDSEPVTATLSGIDRRLKPDDCQIAEVSFFKGTQQLSLSPYLSAAAHVYVLPSDLQEYPRFEHVHALSTPPSTCLPMLPTSPAMTLPSSSIFQTIYIPLSLSNLSTANSRYVTVFIQAKLNCEQSEGVCEPGSRGVFTVKFDLQLSDAVNERCVCPDGGWQPLTEGKCGKVSEQTAIRPLPPALGLCETIDENSTLLTNSTAIQLSIAGSLLRSRTGGIGNVITHLGYTAAYSNNATNLHWPDSNNSVDPRLLVPGYKFVPGSIPQCAYAGFTGSGKLLAAACSVFYLHHICEIPCLPSPTSDGPDIDPEWEEGGAAVVSSQPAVWPFVIVFISVLVVGVVVFKIYGRKQPPNHDIQLEDCDIDVSHADEEDLEIELEQATEQSMEQT